jgi:hypothetical protein
VVVWPVTEAPPESSSFVRGGDMPASPATGGELLLLYRRSFVRGDDPDLASYLRIEEREPQCGFGRNQPALDSISDMDRMSSGVEQGGGTPPPPCSSDSRYGELGSAYEPPKMSLLPNVGGH